MRKLIRSIATVCLTVFPCGIATLEINGAERPTLVRTCDPRPDILPRPIYENWTEYREAYNRPRYLPGKIAWTISRTSQEAMVWEENYCNGVYNTKNAPPICKRYMYPKPWEVLNTGPRPDPTQKSSNDLAPTQADVADKSTAEKPASEESNAEKSKDKEPVDSRKDSEETSSRKAKEAETQKAKSGDDKKDPKAEKPDAKDAPVVPSPSDR